VGSRSMSYTQAMADTICARLAEGETLRSICSDHEMPSAPTIYKWVMDIDSFAKQYARARSVQADVLAEQTLDIADENPAKAFKDIEGDDKTVVMLDGASVQLQRLRIDARKWFASKVAPKKYGEKLDVEHTGDVTVSVVNYAKPDTPV
jgi:Bacteriophage Sf6, terminase small subunit-like